MSLVCLWVHRRHSGFPKVDTGLQYVMPDTAEILLQDDCAQSVMTDARRLKPVSQEPPFVPEGLSVPEVSSPGPARPSRKKRGTYKTRVMRAKK